MVKLHVEFIKLLHKPRTYIGPVVVLVLVGLIIVAMKYGHEFARMQARLARDFIITGSFVNAEFLTRYILLPPILIFYLPLCSCIVFGDLIASEAADGTVRMLLCRPVSRLGIAISKYIVGVIYVIGLVLGLGLAAYLSGSIFLGRGSLLSFSSGIWIIPEHEAIIRLAEVYALVAVGMVAVGSLAFAISTFLSNANGAIAGAVGFMCASGIIGAIDYFSSLRPYLLTTYLEVDKLFRGPLDVHLYAKSLVVMLIYSAVGCAIGLIAFQRRDILS